TQRSAAAAVGPATGGIGVSRTVSELSSRRDALEADWGRRQFEGGASSGETPVAKKALAATEVPAKASV
ncbi:MAG: hypothetical protein L0G72_14390, partial [Brevibacterium aurantiacum]|nr:hypothetical protein [Brevibacterium aurantiacum]